MLIRITALVLAVALFMAERPSSAADQPAGLTHNGSTVSEAQVPAQEAGIVVSINVKKGQFVKKGDLVAQIDDAIPQAEKRRATADHNAAKEKAESDIEIRYATVAAKVAEIEYKKSKEAYDTERNSVPFVDVKRLEVAWQRALLQIERLRVEQRVNKLTVDAKTAEVEAAEEAIRHRQIKAPFDGIVVDVTPQEGEWVKQGETVMRIVRLDRGQVESAAASPH
jgi:multidrug efflux pump subunit AcrA (membrane-fusion protein)